MEETGRNLLISFMLGFTLRLIPEILAFPFPIGFDTLYYAARIRSSVIWPCWVSFFSYTWLFYAISIPLYNILHVEEFLLLKVMGPVLHGLNSVGIYWFAKKALNWNTENSLFASGLFVVQLASLRISWEFLRNTMGLGLLLFTLPLLKDLDSNKNLGLFMGLSLLTVFAHELSGVTLLFIGWIVLLWGWLSRSIEEFPRRRTLFALLPASIIFLTGITLRMLRVNCARSSVSSGPTIIWVKDIARQSYGSLFFFVNYIGMNTSIDVYPSYFHLLLYVLGLFALLYLPYFFLVRKGFFSDTILNAWTFLLLLGSFGCLFFPFFALEYWHRWMFMLVYPFTFYTVNGMRLLLNQNTLSLGEDFRKLRSSKRKVFGALLAVILLGGLYLATPCLMTNVGFGIYSLYPLSKYFASVPTVPYQDVNGVIQAMMWLNDRLDNSSSVVLHKAFAAWANLYLDESLVVIGYIKDVDSAFNLASTMGFEHVFFVCWNPNIGWYGITIPDYVTPVQSFGRISIFKQLK
jgi:hypothetical protein